jgi:small subunit ribosomal protein S1
VTKVVTFGAFVEILPGVEGLVHISELAQHHVENPREVVSQGDAVNVMILEVDAERRRLSLSLKRVDESDQPEPRADGAESVHLTPHLDLSEEVFKENEDGAPQMEDAAPQVEDAAPQVEDDAPQVEDDAPQVEDDAPPVLDDSIAADEASPDEPGPGDSEGGPPEAPDPQE